MQTTANQAMPVITVTPHSIQDPVEHTNQELEDASIHSDMDLEGSQIPPVVALNNNSPNNLVNNSISGYSATRSGLNYSQSRVELVLHRVLHPILVLKQ